MIGRADFALSGTWVQVFRRRASTSFVWGGYSSWRAAYFAGSSRRSSLRAYASEEPAIKDHALGTALEVGGLKMVESLHVDGSNQHKEENEF